MCDIIKQRRSICHKSDCNMRSPNSGFSSKGAGSNTASYANFNYETSINLLPRTVRLSSVDHIGALSLQVPAVHHADGAAGGQPGAGGPGPLLPPEARLTAVHPQDDQEVGHG